MEVQFIKYYTDVKSNRLKYILRFISSLYSIEWLLVEDVQDADWVYAETVETVKYFTQRKSSIIEEGNIQELQTSTSYSNNQLQLHVGYADDTLFDFISAIFYLLSRYEEYLDFEEDEHGRFSSICSDANRHQYLDQPVVDYWIQSWISTWNIHYPGRKILPTTRYSWQPTIDVDIAWAYIHKGWKSYAGFVKDSIHFNFDNAKKRFSSILDSSRDPYYTYDYFDDCHALINATPIYFIQMGAYGGYDESFGKNNKHFQKLIRELASKNQIGIHPSYASNEENDLLKREIESLENIIQRSITLSRQHFLKLHLPNTYSRLIDHNITDDYSMGYADNAGYRAGTSHPFLWYDLRAEKTTDLTVHPFQLMDVTMNKYMNLTPQEVLQLSSNYRKDIYSVEGVMTTIWHNSSFGFKEWYGWERVYHQIAKEMKCQ